MSGKKYTQARFIGMIAGGLVFFALLFSVPVPVAAQSPGTLFTHAEPTEAMLAREAADDTPKPWIVRSRRVAVNFARLCSAKDKVARTGGFSTLSLNLFDDVNYTARILETRFTDTGNMSMVGTIEGIPQSQLIMVNTGDILSMNIQVPGHFYQLRFEANGIHQIIEIDQAQFPSAHQPVPVKDSGRQKAPAVMTANDSGDFVDVLVVYTDDARAGVGGTTAMENLIDLAVTETNTGYANSGVNHRLRLVHTAEVSYDESSFNWSTTLSRLRNTSDGYMDNVHTLRDTYGADEVVLIVNSTSSCGIGYVMQTVSSSFQTNAFCVVSKNCATGYYSFAHELGHNMGCAHNRANASVLGAYTYSFGYQAPDEAFRTIMAYDCAGGCTRVNYWSNPEVNYGGQPMGIVYTDPQAADNRRTLNNTANTTANFRQSVVTPTITVTSPNGGESWNAGSSQTIAWTSSGGVGNVKIEYSSNNGGGWNTVVSSTSNDGSHSWTVPNVDSSQCLVRISEASDSSPTDSSNAVFTIVPTPEITVVAPNGGEQVLRGKNYTVEWTSSGLSGTITIELWKSSSMDSTLGTPNVADGTFTWAVPAGQTLAGDYRIRVYQGGTEDYSDAYFSITSPRNFADFNSDGKPDLIWRYYGTGGRNVIWFMDNTTRTGYQYLSPSTDLNWKIDATGDFNNDGHTDILWRNYGTGDGRTAVWYMNGSTKIGSAWFQRTYNLNWKIVGTGDFNGDGHTDIVWRYDVNGQGQNLIWYMNGVTKTSHAYINAAANTNWKIESVNDFNGDGKPDILWRLYADPGYIVIWFMDNATKTGHTYLPRSTNYNWKIEGSGDFNSDGHTDIVWRNYGTGQNLIWYMNGATKTGHSYFTSVGNLNWDIENN